MKKFVSMFALVALSFAGVASAAQPAHVIAESMSGGGLMRGYDKLQILSSGLVLSESTFNDSPVKVIEIATLSPVAVANLTKKMSELPAVKLVDQTPDKPMCMDAGVGHYYVFNQFGRVEVYKTSGCHEFFREDRAEQGISDLLKALSDLRY